MGAFRPFPSGKAFIGTAAGVGAFTLVDTDGAAVAVGPRQRVIIYGITTVAIAYVAYGTTTVAAVNGSASYPWGLPLPVGKAPAVNENTTGATTIVGEIID